LFDTNLVNLTLDCEEYIFDGGEIPARIPESALEDVEALRWTFFTGKRAYWQLAISPVTYDEIAATPDGGRCGELLTWFEELWHYWRDFFHADNLSDKQADLLSANLVSSPRLAAIPQLSDRMLVAHAIAYRCDAFCTRDRKTILRHRDKLQDLPLRFFSPTEWWRAISPYAHIWL
jgi:hypothetical protein